MNPAATRYAKAARETASPERLLVLLFQTAVRDIRAGATALESGDGPLGSAALVKASEIVVELHASLDATKAPALCEQLASVYRFVCQRLAAAALTRDPRGAREAERALVPIAEAFAGAVGRIGAETTR